MPIVAATSPASKMLAPHFGAPAKLHAQQFRNPMQGEIERLIQQMNANPVADLMKKLEGSALRLQTSLESIRSPFLELDAAGKSLAAAAEIQSIGEALSARQPYDQDLARALRGDLGDWRDRVQWARFDLHEVGSRLDLYAERGFDVEVVDIPEEAFDEVLDLSGLSTSPPSIVDQFRLPIDLPSDVEERDIRRISRACDWLVRFETSLRSFISNVMTRSFGEGWETKRVPGDVLGFWRERQEAARNSGMPVFPLIAYADFTEYEKVICRKDNWREVFQPIFLRKENVQESFQRLYPVRVAAMHSRLLTKDDEMFLFVEIKRMGRALRF